MSSHNEDESQKVFEDLSSTGSTAEISYQLKGLPVFNVFLAFTAIVNNTLILVAIKKVSSLQPLFKLLLLNLAATDLCVGVIAHPLYIVYLMLPSSTAIGVDKLLVQLGGGDLPLISSSLLFTSE